MKDKLLTRAYWHRKYVEMLEITHSKNLLWAKVEELYHTNTGKWLNWRHPKDINEKLMWLNRFYQDPLKTKCADKYLVREFVKEMGLEELIIPVLGLWDNADEIDFDALPDQFALKCNHGSGYNIICLNKASADYDLIKKKLSRWMSQDYSEFLYELHYKNIPRKILAEPLLSQSAPTEYQLWCINGTPESFLVCRKNYDGTYDSGSYSLSWERLNDRINEDTSVSFPVPSVGIERLINYARILAAPFPFVRVDFYVVEDHVYLAEMTFTPSANLLVKYKQSFLDRLGEKLVLPCKS